MRVKSEKMAETEIRRYEFSPGLVSFFRKLAVSLGLYGLRGYLFTPTGRTFCLPLALIILTCMLTAFQH